MAKAPASPKSKGQFKRVREDTDEDDGVDRLTSPQRRELRATFDGMYPFKKFPTSAAVIAAQGGPNFVAAMSPKVDKWGVSFKLVTWVDNRVRNHTCKNLSIISRPNQLIDSLMLAIIARAVRYFEKTEKRPKKEGVETPNAKKSRSEGREGVSFSLSSFFFFFLLFLTRFFFFPCLLIERR